MTSRTMHTHSSSDVPRTTAYLYDGLNRPVVTIAPNDGSGSYFGVSTVERYDNKNRIIAVGGYSIASGLSASTNPLTADTNRVTLSEAYFDVRGRAWKSVQYNIAQADGDDVDSLDRLSWYDAVGRTIKSQGASVTKTMYDRLGRAERQFVLANAADTTYGGLYAAGMVSVSGDTVMEETRKSLQH